MGVRVSRDVIFVPVYVGYDTVVEENSYIRENDGRSKEEVRTSGSCSRQAPS